MNLRTLGIAIVLAAIVIAIVAASGIGLFESPATAPDKPIESASAEKRGGVLRVFQYDSPASMSIHEEAFNSAQNPTMAVFNNLVLFRQDVPQNRIDTIEPDLATKWSWCRSLYQQRVGACRFACAPAAAIDGSFGQWD